MMNYFLFSVLIAVFCVGSIKADDGNYGYPPETPVCAVRCAPIVKVLCAGPITGCGKWLSFNNICMMGGWNCNHPSHKFEKKYNGACYPGDHVIGA